MQFSIHKSISFVYTRFYQLLLLVKVVGVFNPIKIILYWHYIINSYITSTDKNILINKIMSKLKLRTDYLGLNQELLVKEHVRNVVSLQIGGICHEPQRPPFKTEDLATIVAKILEDNPHFELKGLTSTVDGAILCFKQVIPEPFVVEPFEIED